MIDVIPIHSRTDVSIAHQHIGRTDLIRYEKMHTEIFENSDLGSTAVAREIASLIRYKQSKGERCILGLATGSSPISVYEELVRMHRKEGLSFSNVVTFNLDEYFPMEASSPQSYWYFMHEHLFNHVDINPKNINIPSGAVDIQDVYEFCMDYENKIKSYGGLDFQLLGIGRTGHVGFNEPGSHEKSLTRLITLDHLTRADAAADFRGMDNVPKRAITMGIDTIKQAKRVVLLAWGHKKADIVSTMLEGQVSSDVPATFLQDHTNVTVILDREASSALTRYKTPWLVGPCQWDDKMIRKAIVWLSHKVGKTILKLTERDYNHNGMSDLLAQEGSAYELNIKMHNSLQRTITGWPGGKPNVDDAHRPERAKPASKRVIIFSPHPDDDVISMGGTFLRLVNQGHDVHVAYQTSGNIAVADHEALRFAEFTKAMADRSMLPTEKIDIMIQNLKNKSEEEIDSVEIREIKGLIRQGEARAGARYCGLPDDHIHFLNMPFYETGKVKKNPIGAADVSLIKDLIQKIKPHQIFAAGDLADPHGTHRVCLDAIFAALTELKSMAFMKDCWVWLYRGAWHEWPVDEIEMAIPLSPEEVERKRKAIFFHQSQKDGVMFQGNDQREFWQRAEDRNRSTATLYNQLGLTEYEAMEAFVRHHY
jgi:glucosamine-6-phosphate deaminase